ncbi:MAG: winged helix-turn-helix transcriptional regulator [candidate division WOR-3 bacterium]|nr:MAG: winged helix-turn-helix transcriptional regulator [candidate division WOR-3 bacterium]
MKITEKKYRGSVMCRILGYPITYAIVKLLLEHGPMELDEIVRRVKISKPGVSLHLKKLKIANIVRYEKRWPKTYYWIKYPEEVKDFLDASEKLVIRTTKRIKKDY